MKNLCIIFARTLAVGIVSVQLILLAARKAGLAAAAVFPVPEIMYLAIIMAATVIQLIISRPPSFPGTRLGKILETEGYSPRFYGEVFRWCDKCGDDNRVRAELVAAELLIDGGHFTEGFERLSGIDAASLDPTQKQIYFNTCLYGAVLGGDLPLAERIYSGCGKRLLAVDKRPLAASVKHTLGCFEYMRGDTLRAETLLMQALESASSDDVLCEVWLALSLCYLDTDRRQYAENALRTAAEHACTLPLKQKVSRAKELVCKE